MTDDARPEDGGETAREAAARDQDAARDLAEQAAARDQAAALARAARQRDERRREADRNEVFNDVYKTVDDIRSEWHAATKKQWFWVIGLALTVLGGLVVPVLLVLSLIAAVGTAMSWETARERKRAYKRVLFERDLEQKILEHEARTRTNALRPDEPSRESG